jgi:hypothetical protein
VLRPWQVMSLNDALGRPVEVADPLALDLTCEVLQR